MDRNKSELNGGMINLLKPILRLWQSKMKEKVSRLFNMQPALGSVCSPVSFDSIDVLVAFDSVLISRHCIDCLLV